jgi:putative flippase GtrA
MLRNLSRRIDRHLLGASVSAVAATSVDVAALSTLVHRGAPIALATFVGCTAGAVTSFTVSKYLAFADRRPVSLDQVGRFAVLALISALIMSAAMHVVASDLHVPYLLAKLVCAALVFIGWSFPAQRRIFAAAS